MWPAAFALIVTASGGGVNAAVTAWMLVGPLLLALYERWMGWATWRDLWRFGWRTALATALVSAWWVVPLLVQSRFGVDFLRFTEQPGTIWSTTSLSESLRLLGYWISYLGVGYGGELRPYFGSGGVMLFALPVVVAGLLVPALALTGFAWTRTHALRPVRAAARDRRPAGHERGLPGGHAAAARRELHVQPRRARPVPADDVQGRAAGGDRDRGAGRPRRRAGAEARLAGRGAAAPAGRELAAAARSRGRRPAAVGSHPVRVAARRPTTSTRARAAPSSCPASSTRTTTGAARSTRSCRCWRTRRWRRATPSATPTCARPTCCGRSTRSSSSGGRCPASSTRCWTCSAPARCWPAPTTTAPAAARRPPPTPPTCSTSSARPTPPGASSARADGRRARSDRRAALPQVRAWDRPGAPGLVRVEPERAARSVRRRLGRGRGRAGRLRRSRARRTRLRGRPHAGRDPPRAPRS